MELLRWIGAPGEEPGLRQYLAWSNEVGLFEALESGPLSASNLGEKTLLSEAGVDALTGVLLALGLLRRDAAELVLTDLATTYLLSSSPYWVGEFLFFGQNDGLPAKYCKNSIQHSLQSSRLRRLWQRLVPPPYWRDPWVMANTHARNFSPTVKAARAGLFSGITHLVDVAGGTGTFSIPLMLEYPQMKVTMIDLPPVVEIARDYLARYGLENRVTLRGMDVFQKKWSLGDCDAIFFGNFLHGSNDEQCEFFCKQSFDALQEGGQIFIHEMIWNDDKDGPLVTALWNAKMRSICSGRQRTANELSALCRAAGFEDDRVIQTSGCWSLVCGRKREGG
jgi:acetylserotonin N-methyltransferase